MKSKFKVADVLNLEQDYLEQLSFTSWHYRTLLAIRKCRTSALGGHIDQCTCCKKIHISYNSCRNRHCPTCQGYKREQWIQARETELLNTPYFHVVFTLPHELNRFCLLYGKEIYTALFRSAWLTIKQFSQTEMGTLPGMIAVLHTWATLEIIPLLLTGVFEIIFSISFNNSFGFSIYSSDIFFPCQF